MPPVMLPLNRHVAAPIPEAHLLIALDLVRFLCVRPRLLRRRVVLLAVTGRADAPLPAALIRGVHQHLRRRILHVVAPICRADKAAAARRDAAA